MGTAAAGAGAVFGSGAFTQVQTERDLTIGVDKDSSALLELSANSGVASVANGDNGKLVINTDRLSSEDEANSQGFAVGSTVDIGGIDETGDVSSGEEAFSITNNFDDVGDGNANLDVGIDLTSIDLSSVSGLTSLEFYGTPSNSNGTQVTSAGGRNVFDVASDETIHFAIRFTTASTTGPQGLDATVTFQAGSDLTSDDFPTEQPVETIVRDSDGVSFSSIQTAINDGGTEDGETLRVGAGTYDESVTIDVEGLTLEAGDGPSPTVDGNGEIPVTVSASNVSVDNENINFQSGIDVGADFSDYDPGLTESEADAVVGPSEGYDSIGNALNTEQSDTSILVKSDYDASNESSDNDGSSSALISIVYENVEVISEEGPEETVIDERPDAEGDGRAVDINAANVVFKGFDVADASQEGIVVTGVENAEGIEITDNKITSDNDGILVAEFGPEGFNSASTDGIQIVNNEIKHERVGISPGGGDQNPVIERNTIIGTNDEGAAKGNGERGIQISSGVTDATVESNLVKTSYVGFQRADNGNSVDSLTNNHIIDNDLLDVANSAGGELDAAENWFGTEDIEAIGEQIGGSGGDIVFDPFAGAPIDPDA